MIGSLGKAIATRVVPDASTSAAVALLDMATEGGRATLLDGGHDTAVSRRHGGAGLETIGNEKRTEIGDGQPACAPRSRMTDCSSREAG
jgi:hypothetical protein